MILLDDGHRFDDTLLEFTLSAMICKTGGYIVLDDMWMPSVRKVASFVRANRQDFTEIKTPSEDFAAFQKTGEDHRDWRHFEDFKYPAHPLLRSHVHDASLNGQVNSPVPQPYF